MVTSTIHGDLSQNTTATFLEQSAFKAKGDFSQTPERPFNYVLPGLVYYPPCPPELAKPTLKPPLAR